MQKNLDDIPASVPSEKESNINHPNHYCQGGIECIKVIEAAMSPDGFQDYCKGNVLKYLCRWRDKNGGRRFEESQSLSGLDDRIG